MTKLLVFALPFLTITALAADPACVGKNQDLCDMLGAMLLTKGKPCKTMYSVTPIASRDGGNTYRIVCKETSTSYDRVTYLLAFGTGNRSYNVY